MRTSTGLTGFKVGKMAFSDCLLCFSRKSNRNLCSHKDHGDFIAADPAPVADQLPDAQLLGEGIPGLRVLSPSSTGMSSTAGGPLAFNRV